jgi:hypothetical protein
MILNVIVDEQTYPIRVSDEIITEGRDFFEKIDADMDRGWQMSRKWVDRPDDVQRCQIAADKILTAVETENEKLAALMAAYILQRMPNIDSVDIDISGDMTATELIMKEGS